MLLTTCPQRKPETEVPQGTSPRELRSRPPWEPESWVPHLQPLLTLPTLHAGPQGQVRRQAALGSAPPRQGFMMPPYPWGQPREGALRVPVLQGKASQQTRSTPLPKSPGEDTAGPGFTPHFLPSFPRWGLSDHAAPSLEYQTYSS